MEIMSDAAEDEFLSDIFGADNSVSEAYWVLLFSSPVCLCAWEFRRESGAPYSFGYCERVLRRKLVRKM